MLPFSQSNGAKEWEHFRKPDWENAEENIGGNALLSCCAVVCACLDTLLPASPKVFQNRVPNTRAKTFTTDFRRSGCPQWLSPVIYICICAILPFLHTTTKKYTSSVIPCYFLVIVVWCVLTMEKTAARFGSIDIGHCKHTDVVV